MKPILIIEDDARIGPTVRKGLTEHGFEVQLAASGQEAVQALSEESPGLVILDLGLPDCDGLELMGVFRERGYQDPVLILTARDEVRDKVAGFEAGADDYLVKPFAFSELLARVRALLRRAPTVARTLRAGDLTVDLVTRHVQKAGLDIELTPREFDMLAYLAQQAGVVVSRDMLAEHVWRETKRFTPLDNVIDVHVSRLRRKLGAVPGSGTIAVVRGVGVKLGIES